MERITNERLQQALEHYVSACRFAGLGDDDLAGAVIAQPYGLAYMVCRKVDSNWIHDLPGFRSDTAGKATKREVYEQLHQSAKVLFELAYFFTEAVKA